MAESLGTGSREAFIWEVLVWKCPEALTNSLGGGSKYPSTIAEDVGGFKVLDMLPAFICSQMSAAQPAKY